MILEPTLFEENPFLRTVSQRLLKAREEGQLLLQPGDTGFASAPSNIALLKYWGKQPGHRQIPVNSSLSLTLGHYRAITRMTVLGRFYPLKNGLPATSLSRPEFILRLNGRNESMPAKMEHFLKNILAFYAPDIALQVESENNFPTACGVASSAAGYAALVGAVADVIQLRRFVSEDEYALWLAEWARLGSGSATRSALTSNDLSNKNQFVAWELLNAEKKSSNLQQLTSTTSCVAHENFDGLRHCVLVLDAEQKKTGSSEGHELAQTSVLQAIRLAQYPSRFQSMCEALRTGDIRRVAELTEIDAFEMHAVMGTGALPLHYMSSQTAAAIRLFVEQRQRSGALMFWTLDAGPNPHFIYDMNSSGHMSEFLMTLARDEKFKAARVLMTGRSVAQGLLVGEAEMERNGIKPFVETSEPLLRECDLQSAALAMLKSRAGSA